jgi:hypothetical protein
MGAVSNPFPWLAAGEHKPMPCACRFFCEACGDCMECNAGEPCYALGEPGDDHVPPDGWEAHLEAAEGRP